MDNIDFIELAKYCVSQYKEAHNSNEDHYVNTLFVSISEDNQLRRSLTPHVLSNANRCLLIHQHSQLAVTNYYSWYKVQYIDENGCVSDGNLGGGYTLSVISYGSFSNMRMTLRLNNTDLYSCRAPFEDKVAKFWELYQKVKDISSQKEVKLVADLFRKDEEIFELEKQVEDFEYEKYLLEQERNQYKELLEEIKEMMGNR